METTKKNLRVGTLLAKARFNEAWAALHPKDPRARSALESAARYREAARIAVRAGERGAP